MTEFTVADTLRLAKRFNNPKRSWLLVNPLQAKHIPVSPGAALAMMRELGERLSRRYPECGLVIGFAETATAIGAAVAGCLGGDCVYLHTTREELAEECSPVEFLEEHSHAAEQRLATLGLGACLARTESVIFVDDEISTGKTLLNMISRLREQYPELGRKRLAAASLLNRVSREDEERLAAAGVACEYLVKVPELADFAGIAEQAVREAPPVSAQFTDKLLETTLACNPWPDPRCGVSIRDYRQRCAAVADCFVEWLRPQLKPDYQADYQRAVVLGTEECMYPALALGSRLESQGLRVRCHATTRSPIGICRAPGYPICGGFRLGSFYQAERTTYIYNPEPCDILVVVSDAAAGLSALRELAAAWRTISNDGAGGWRQLYYIQGGNHVWYI